MYGSQELKSLGESRMAQALSAVDLKKYEPLVDAIRADYSKEFDRMNRVSIDEFNAPVWREKWYIPLIRLDVTGDTHEARLKADLLGNNAGTGVAGTEKGFTKKRVQIGPTNQAPVELGLYKTWADSVDRTEHFIAYAGYIRDLNRVFLGRQSGTLKLQIQDRYGKQMYDYLDSYIKEVANPQNKEPTKALDKVMHVMRGNTAPAYLGWKLSSIIKQGIESPAPFMQFVNPVEYLHACIDLAKSSEIRDSISEKSAFMKARVFDPMVDIINENVEKSFNKKNYLLRKFQQKGMSGLEWIDWACVAPGWLAAYTKEYNRLQDMSESLYEERLAELRENNIGRTGNMKLTEDQLAQSAADDVAQNIEEEAVRKADDVVRLCQPSNRNADLSPMFKNSSEAVKAVLQFQAALNVIWQNIRYDIPYALKNHEYKNVVGMVTGYVMAGIMSGLVVEGLGGDDDEPEDKAKKTAYFATTQFLDSIPIVGSKIDGLAKKAITGEGAGFYSSSLWPTFDKYYNSAKALTDGDYQKMAKNLEQGLALSLGLPLSGAKELEAAIGYGDGDGELELNPGALVGRRK